MKSAPVLLAIETSTPACSVALVANDKYYARFELAPQQHTQLILPMILAVLSEAKLELSDMDALAVGVGPGSFTGIRIGVSLIQSLGFGLEIPIYPISTLHALAQQALPIAQQRDPLPLICSTMDARMSEIYSALYQPTPDGLQLHIPEKSYNPTQLTALFQATSPHPVVIGFGWDEKIPHLEAYPRAEEVAFLACQQWRQGRAGVLAQDLKPSYVRQQVAAKKNSTIEAGL